MYSLIQQDLDTLFSCIFLHVQEFLSAILLQYLEKFVVVLLELILYLELVERVELSLCQGVVLDVVVKDSSKGHLLDLGNVYRLTPVQLGLNVTDELLSLLLGLEGLADFRPSLSDAHEVRDVTVRAHSFCDQLACHCYPSPFLSLPVTTLAHGTNLEHLK